MKFAATFMLVGFLVAAAVADDPPKPAPAQENLCANVGEERNFKNKQSGQGFFGAWHCMTYTHCKDKKPVTEHCLGWPLIPLRQYSPSAKNCEWFWRVKCSENDA